MKTNKHGQIILDESDLCDAVMRGQEIRQFGQALVDNSVDLETAAQILEDVPAFVRYNELVDQMTTEEFDHRNQQVWFMPEQYQTLDIAQYALSLCESDQELQRVGQELLMYQERNLFDLLRYLKYLVDVMTEHRLVWGVGRGSSVASYVLYKLGVHRIDSLYYDLDPAEFLR
jgi:DNA polymerase III alpha subunit